MFPVICYNIICEYSVDKFFKQITIKMDNLKSKQNVLLKRVSEDKDTKITTWEYL